MKRLWLSLEWAILYLVLPVMLAVLMVKGALFAALWALAIMLLVVFYKRTRLSLKSVLFNFRTIPKDAWRPILSRFMVCAFLMTAFTYLYVPERLFQFPTEKPLLWAMVMIFYPLFSVFPQEVMYRLFFFERYQSLFSTPTRLIAASAVAFAMGHVMFNNWVAIFLSLIGGSLFAHTYHKYRHFGLLWVEHALYGCFLFTIGLGWFFYHGAANQHHF